MSGARCQGSGAGELGDVPDPGPRRIPLLRKEGSEGATCATFACPLSPITCHLLFCSSLVTAFMVPSAPTSPFGKSQTPRIRGLRGPANRFRRPSET